MNGISLHNTNKTKIQFNQNKNMSWFSKLFKRQEAAIKRAKIEQLKSKAKGLEWGGNSLRDQELRNLQSCLDPQRADIIKDSTVDNLEKKIKYLEKHPYSAGRHAQFRKK